MPAKSKSQQKAAGAALSAKRGDQKVSDLKGPSKSMYESMSEQQLDEMASTKRKGKPEHKSKKSLGAMLLGRRRGGPRAGPAAGGRALPCASQRVR